MSNSTFCTFNDRCSGQLWWLLKPRCIGRIFILFSLHFLQLFRESMKVAHSGLGSGLLVWKLWVQSSFSSVQYYFPLYNTVEFPITGPSSDCIHRASLESAGPQNCCDWLTAFGERQLPADSHSACMHADACRCMQMHAAWADCHRMQSSSHKNYCAPQSVRAL